MKKNTEDQRLALVTGGNKGIGLEVCRQLGRLGLHVILSARDPEKGNTAAALLQVENLAVDFCPLDVSLDESVLQAARWVAEKYGHLDVLVNNAAIHLDHDLSIASLPLDVLRQTLEVNMYGILRTSQAFLPMMKALQYGRIVNVSSKLGQHAMLKDESSAYRLSKVAINALTQMLADSVKEPNILINACSPGWVRTDMGSMSAPRSVEQGADTIVWLATLPARGPTGGFFHDRKRIDW